MKLVCAGLKRPSVHSESSAETMWVASIDDVVEQMKNKDARLALRLNLEGSIALLVRF